MNGKFIVYALVVSFIATGASWSKLLASPSMQSFGSGSSWSSSTGSRSSWSSGSHK